MNHPDRIKIHRQHFSVFGGQSDDYCPLMIDGKHFAINLESSDEILDLGILDSVLRGIPIKTDLMEKNEMTFGTLISPHQYHAHT